MASSKGRKDLELSLQKIKNTDFGILYEKILTDKMLSRSECIKLLSIAIIFINCDKDEIKKLGYRIIVMYGNKTHDYSPLYEIAMNNGLYPIIHFIDTKTKEIQRNEFVKEFNAAIVENCYEDGVYKSEEQFILSNFIRENNNESLSVIAPTSYGKTELILNILRDNPNKNVCIITPTKSLLAQTRNRILKAKIEWIKKIVIYPEMYFQNDSECVTVTTQERLLRLLKNNESLTFDYVIIDEAHNLLNNDSRNKLLSSVIIMLNKRNINTAFKFLTPFMCEESNLKIKYTSYELESYKIQEYIKTEKFYLYDVRNKAGLSIYDQFLNSWYELQECDTDLSEIEFILKFASNKNIIYLNKPKDIERFVIKMVEKLPDVQNDKIDIAIKNIAEQTHPDYLIIKCLKKGVIYHHGSVPEIIKTYIEKLFSEVDDIRFVVTSSTLLEGVNLPADKLFILDNRRGRGNLPSAGVKNLIGRICRFSEVFNENNLTLDKLEPEVYFVFGEYFTANANCKKFIMDNLKINKIIKDEVNNILLENKQITSEDEKTELIKSEEFIENYQKGSIEDYGYRIVKTEIGQSCILNNVFEFDVFENEYKMQEKLQLLKDNYILIKDVDILMKCIQDIFINRLDKKVKKLII